MDSPIFSGFISQASRYSKMEKADILEMTVNYMRAMQRKDKRAAQGEISSNIKKISISLVSNQWLLRQS